MAVTPQGTAESPSDYDLAVEGLERGRLTVESALNLGDYATATAALNIYLFFSDRVIEILRAAVDSTAQQ